MDRRALHILASSLLRSAESRLYKSLSRVSTLASSSYDPSTSSNGPQQSPSRHSSGRPPWGGALPPVRATAEPGSAGSYSSSAHHAPRPGYLSGSLPRRSLQTDPLASRVAELRQREESARTSQVAVPAGGKAKQRYQQRTGRSLVDVKSREALSEERSHVAHAVNGASLDAGSSMTGIVHPHDSHLGPSRPSNNGQYSPEGTLSQPYSASTSARVVVVDSDAEGDFEADIPEEAINEVYQNVPPPDVHVVNTAAGAKAVVEKLMSMTGRVFACDTEVMDIDVSKQSPNCHGRVICFSIYCGPDVHFGLEPSPEVNQSMVWVDTYLDGDESKQEEIDAIIDSFKLFFASEQPKIWHNYSFDRHVLERAGLFCGGFHGDTMHMARLWDSSRTGRGGYSLEALSSDPELMAADGTESVRGKVSMKKLFAKPNVKKDGTPGKLLVLPPVHELQRGEETKWRWVNYSAYDAKSTWDLHEALRYKLMEATAGPDPAVAEDFSRHGKPLNTLWDIYCHLWRPFGALLTDLEAAGMAVDREHLRQAQEKATAEEEDAKARFRGWASSKVPDAQYMNVGSGSQVSQLLFAGIENRSAGKGGVEKPGIPDSRIFKVPNQLPPEEGKKAKKNMDITLHGVWGPGIKSPLVPDIYTPSGVPACSTQVLKGLAGKAGRARKALAELDSVSTAEGLENIRDEEDEELSDPWSVDDAEITKAQLEKQEATRVMTKDALQNIAQKEGYGKLFSEFGTVYDGLRACAAVDSLVDASAIDTLLTGFIIPLQSDDISKPDSNGVYRVHCALNINTETGRLSARRPNLQNQPALEKDRYKVRKAFTADIQAGKTLIVADYGQLELRILAHMAACHSMIEAFKLGGDFHSRTALGMYDHIQSAIERGECLLEWDGGAEGAPAPAPLLKDMFAAERRKAKVLNFSIAYGKTAHGLSKDWGVSLKEAEDTVNRWYSDRKEVRKWQEEQYRKATEQGWVETLLGRRRQLPDAKSSNKAMRAHAMRAAINTPIQGSAADVATAAMLRINSHEELKDLGWRLLLQVHDEVILEGPKETAAQAQQLVVECMQSPFNGGECPLLIDLAVDSKYADSWYDAK